MVPDFPPAVGRFPGKKRKQKTMNRPTFSESGQATAEYALVIVAAATIALALILWVSSTPALSGLFDAVVAKVTSYV